MKEAKKVNTISLKVADINVLYMAYMPYLSDGGIFIPTKNTFSPGDVIRLHVSLPEEVETFNVRSKVVWITPSANQSNKAMGVGVMFHKKEGQRLKHKIETLIAPLVNTDNFKSTHTI